MSRRKKDSDSIPWWVIVIGIFLILITIGLIFKVFSDYEPTEKKTGKTKEKEDLLADAIPTKEQIIKEKKHKLEKIQTRLSELLPIKDEIALRERRLIVRARYLTAFFLIFINSLYTYYLNWPMKLDSFLNLNELVLLIYSFVAFVTYGTPTNLINGLKEQVAQFLKRQNIDSLEEIEMLTKERDLLIKEIEDLKNTP